MKRADILHTAEKCVCGQREQDYGSPENNFQTIADFWSVYKGVHSKMKTVCEKLDTSIDRLANDTEVDIPAKVIDQAVQRAVDRESYSAVKRATDEVMDDVKREIESRVGAVVKEHYDAISDGVTDQIAKNVAKIDEGRLRKEVVQKAKEQIAEKFDDKLDDILEEFNGNLQNVGKIYKSIAKSFSKEDI